MADGRLFVTGNACPPAAAAPTLVAIDTTTGNELWRHESPASEEGANDSRLVLGTGAGVIIPLLVGPLEALDVTTGAVLWTRDGVSCPGRRARHRRRAVGDAFTHARRCSTAEPARRDGPCRRRPGS